MGNGLENRNLKQKIIDKGYDIDFAERTFQLASYIASRMKASSRFSKLVGDTAVLSIDIFKEFRSKWQNLGSGTSDYEIRSSLTHLVHASYLSGNPNQNNFHEDFRVYSLTNKGRKVFS